MGRDGKHERCSICKTYFPCKHACTHLDCIEVREGRAHELGLDFPGRPKKEP